MTRMRKRTRKMMRTRSEVVTQRREPCAKSCSALCGVSISKVWLLMQLSTTAPLQGMKLQAAASTGCPCSGAKVFHKGHPEGQLNL